MDFFSLTKHELLEFLEMHSIDATKYQNNHDYLAVMADTVHQMITSKPELTESVLNTDKAESLEEFFENPSNLKKAVVLTLPDPLSENLNNSLTRYVDGVAYVEIYATYTTSGFDVKSAQYLFNHNDLDSDDPNITITDLDYDYENLDKYADKIKFYYRAPELTEDRDAFDDHILKHAEIYYDINGIDDTEHPVKLELTAVVHFDGIMSLELSEELF